MSETTASRLLRLGRTAAFRSCVTAGETLGWGVRADRGEGGLDVDVPGSWALLRPKATLEVRLADVDGGTRVTVRPKMSRLKPWARAQAAEISSAYLTTVEGRRAPGLRAGAGSPEKAAIRVCSLILIAVAFVGASTVALPEARSADTQSGAPGDERSPAAERKPDLPAVALGQEAIYRLEIGVLIFYGGLVVLTPLFFGAVRGKLPNEVSARGAKFAEAKDELEGSLQEASDRLDALTKQIKANEDDLDLLRIAADNHRGWTERNIRHIARQAGTEPVD